MRTSVIAARFLVLAALSTSLSIVHTGAWKKQEAATAGPPPAESVIAKVDQLFAAWNRSDSPGCSLGVSQDGALVSARAYGMANLELGAAITRASVFHVASISKQFTAMSTLLLAERGQLSLDDEVRKHVPEWADSGHRLTLRHLLTHTGGLRDPFLLRELAAPRDDVFGNDAIVNLLARQRELNFPPGSEFQYSNGGYTLLAAIVKRVTGQSLRAFADANIFKPLGMTHTHIHDDPTMVVPNRASGYHRDGGALHVAPLADLGHIVGTTALFTTARDLLVWQQNFADLRVGDPALLAAMQAPTVLAGGDTSPYGFGLQIQQHRGLRTIGHGGGDPGYSAQVVRYPDQRFAVAVLCNLHEIDSVQLARDVAEIYLAHLLGSTSANNSAAPLSVSLSPEQLASKVGLYRDPSNESLLRISVRDGKLMGSSGAGHDASWELAPMSANRFIIAGTAVALEFVPRASGRTQHIHVTGDLPKTQVLQQLEAFAPSSAQLRAFAGEYTSPDLDVTYGLGARASGLVIQIPGRKDIVLQPIFPDGFAGELVGVVKFARDARGAVTGFTVNTYGVRSLRFDRVKRSG